MLFQRAFTNQKKTPCKGSTPHTSRACGRRALDVGRRALGVGGRASVCLTSTRIAVTSSQTVKKYQFPATQSGVLLRTEKGVACGARFWVLCLNRFLLGFSGHQAEPLLAMVASVIILEDGQVVQQPHPRVIVAPKYHHQDF